MTDDFNPKLNLHQLLIALKDNIGVLDYFGAKAYDSTQQKQISNLILAFDDLISYFLWHPEKITTDYKPYILRVFKMHPNDDPNIIHLLELCAKCIITALKSQVKTVIQPSDFSFSNVIEHVNSEKYSDEAIIDFLEIIFTISDKQASDIANADPHDIDKFFKYYDKFDKLSKISCLKCINNIVSHQVFARFVIFLPILLDIASDPEQSISQLAIQAFITISKEISDINTNISENFNPLEYCQKLCKFTCAYKDLRYLGIFIDSIRACIISSAYTIQTVFSIMTSFLIKVFENISETSVLRSSIRLILALMPYPDDDLIQLYPDQEFKWTNKEFISKTTFSIAKEVIPHIIRIYYTNLTLSKLCLQALCIFANTKDFQIQLPYPVIYMMHFQLSNYDYVPYILLIIKPCSNLNENLEPIVRSKLLERIMDISNINQLPKDIHIHQYCDKVIKEIQNKLYLLNTDNTKLEFENINQLIQLIKQNQLSPFDLLSSFLQAPKSSSNYVKTIKKLLDPYKNLDSIEDDARVLVDFLLKMLADIPIPLLYTDPYLRNYNQMVRDEIVILNENGNTPVKISFSSLLSKYSERKSYNENRIEQLFKNPKNNDISKIFNYDILRHQNNYLLDILLRELSDDGTEQYRINDIIINDPDQFVLTILPQISKSAIDESENSLDTNAIPDLRKIIVEKQYRIKVDRMDEKVRPSKNNNLIPTLRLMKGGEIVQEILDILNLLYEKDQRHHINFVYEPFIKGIREQMKYLFLSLCLFSPCSQMMVNYPFLFPMSDRYYLFQLHIKEPLMAKDFYIKTINPDFIPEKRTPCANIQFIVDRDQVFKEGILILERFAKYRAALEISFRNEDGIGKGPTREFFNLMSNEFRKKRHRLWRRDNYSSPSNEELYSFNKQGLFPNATACSRYMHALGLFIAKAIQMEQIIDIPFNPAFFDLASGREILLSDVDREYAISLNDESSPEAFKDSPFVITIEKRDFEIVKNGQEVFVTLENYPIFKKAIEDFICGKYVKKKIDAFVDGFSEVLDPMFLKMFTGKEMVQILNGNRELLTAQSLSQFIQCEDGYDNDSTQIRDLIDIVSNFDRDHQHFFIQFVTGSPFLPFGGLAALDHPLKIVKKVESEKSLPSASTCINKLKLPPYPSKEIMREKLIMAITEGRDSFDLT